MGKSYAKAYANTAAVIAVSSPASGDLFVEFDPDNDDAQLMVNLTLRDTMDHASLQVQGSPLGNTDVSTQWFNKFSIKLKPRTKCKRNIYNRNR